MRRISGRCDPAALACDLIHLHYALIIGWNCNCHASQTAWQILAGRPRPGSGNNSQAEAWPPHLLLPACPQLTDGRVGKVKRSREGWRGHGSAGWETMPRSTPIIPDFDSVSAGHCWESWGEKTQPAINQSQWGGTRRESGRCAGQRPLQGKPDDLWKDGADPSVSLNRLCYDFGKTAACLIELNVAYFRLVLRFPAHLANIDITSIPLDAVIVLSSCYNTDRGKQRQSDPLWDCHWIPECFGRECCFPRHLSAK